MSHLLCVYRLYTRYRLYQELNEPFTLRLQANASTDYTKRDEQGWFCNNVQHCLGNDGKKCGIYEWSLSAPWLKETVVVYVGSTCRKKEGSQVKGNKTQAGEAENALLQKYDYAWNKRENGKKRKIFP